MRALGIVFTNMHDATTPDLVSKRTFASIPFAGRYRLIDFVLSNMVNSGIDTLGVITKSNYQSLMDHIGNGKDWDLARKNGGLIILPPYGNTMNNGLYTSRISALRGITGFLNRADEEYVVMTDCDMVCNIDYSKVIENHIANNADITLVYTKVNGVTNLTNPIGLETENGRVKSIKDVAGKTDEVNLFMNIFVMRKSVLQRFVLETTAHDRSHFTTELLASRVDDMVIRAYEYDGYVSCIDSLQNYYDANLALLVDENRKALFGDQTIYTKVKDSAPTRYGNNAVVKNSLIADGCVIEGEVENSIIFRGVKIGRGTVVKNCVLMQNTVTGENVTLNAIIADKNVVIKDRRTLCGAEDHPFYIAKGSLI